MTSQTTIHLCQPDLAKSCGACCGLYNYRDNRKQVLEDRLRRRTVLYESLKGDLTTYSREAQAFEGKKLYATIYNCEFLGFVDGHERRVGCLLHPELNNNRDLRRHSFYGGDLCRDHFCPSYHTLTPVEQKAVVETCGDWYLYGLCVTDIDLVKSFFFHLHTMLGEEMDAKRMRGNHELRRVLGEFFSWKAEWPYRRAGALRLGKYYFVESDYFIAAIDYAALGVRRSVYDAILVSLASEFTSKVELTRAESLIRYAVEDAAHAYLTA